MNSKRRYFPGDSDWTIVEGSVLDEAFLKPLGTFNVVYSWGVLHHTGAMWQALEHVSRAVGEQEKLFIAIYNEQERENRRWLFVKRLYNRLLGWARFLVLGPAMLRPLCANISETLCISSIRVAGGEEHPS
jgi:2-polyprenyl-6-hydroxyphenyl methylase/3-demethylubiquinone-9 3-methyltransferase